MIALLAACGKDPQGAPARVATPLSPVSDAAIATAVGPCPVAKSALGPGLTLERWHVADATPAAGEPCIDVVRADPAHYTLRALTDKPRTATEWQSTFNLVAVINAGMFHDSGDPVGLVVADTKSRGVDNAKFGGYFVWDPDAKLAAANVLGRGCPNANDREHYRSLVQSYRLLDCNGGAINWQDPKQYSAAAIGVDRAGRIVFLHARGAFTMRELSTALASHDLAGAIFLEGGPEASLVVHGADGSFERMGSYETSFVENDGNTDFWKLPNVIALVTSSGR